MAHVPAAQRRSQLIDTAIDLMTREGAAAGSTRAIAAELGVAQMTVHYVFGSKAEFTRAIMDELSRRVVERIRPTAERTGGRSFREDVADTVAELWRDVREDTAEKLLWIELCVQSLRDPTLRAAIAEHNANMYAVAAELLTAIARRHGVTFAAPAESVARFLLCGLEGMINQHLAEPDEAAERTCLDQLVTATTALALGERTPSA
ncbi:TetR/AcrR family transcriptional regulator [Nocardiopsis lucentensis]|uniref:TetR/AcrR family transcriptional regulator n=1 Tax=Nocardiopsis lucentensis TaxID=53441 RepID=UPI000476728B|nr:TetR/AcrR family transcriptional regulator [Nocardiopsis lucentensis]